MKLKIATVFAIPLLVAMAAQAATASEHRYARTKGRAATFEQLRNSNAYAAPAPQSYAPDYDDGAMASGVAGH